MAVFVLADCRIINSFLPRVGLPIPTKAPFRLFKYPLDATVFESIA